MGVTSLEPMLDRNDLARILKKSPITIRNMVSRCPEKLPPFLRVGSEARWVPQDVWEWIEEQKNLAQKPRTMPRHRGRPTKAEQVKSRRAEAAE